MAMITAEQARSIAQRHLDANPLGDPEYAWVLPAPREIPQGWYFDYMVKCLLDIPEEEWTTFLGAPGFLVSKASGEIRDVGWEELGDLGVSG
jgi:hypothetical protein